MTLDELKQAALNIAAKHPRPPHYDWETVKVRMKAVKEARIAYLGNAKPGSALWNLRVAQMNCVLTNEFSYGEGLKPHEVEAAIRRAAEVKAMPADAIIKRAETPVLEEQALFFQMLPVNPVTGEKNPQAPTLNGFWMLDCIVDNVLTNPKYGFKKKLKDLDAIPLNLVEFDVSTTENRKTIGRERWSNAEQQKAFEELRALEFRLPRKWNPDKGKHGGWEGYELKTVTTFHSIVPRDAASEERWGKRGAPAKDGSNDQLRFKGILTGPVGEVLILNAVFNRRFLAIPQKCYSISRASQILYRQGIPFVASRTGWLLKFVVACRALGYDENERRNRDKYIRHIEDKCLPELEKAFGWRRDREWESRMRKAGEIGEGRETGWVLRAPRKLGRKRPRRLKP